MVIEGLKVTVDGAEVRELCVKRAAHHRERAAAYAEQITNMQNMAVEGMNYTNGDPVRALTEKKAEHEGQADELDFIAAHIAGGSYMLQREDLHRLGICKNRY